MIHEEICTYEVAKLAKEKGFPVKEIECWYCEFDGRPTKEIVDNQQYPIIPQSLLQRWLREEKGLILIIRFDPSEQMYDWGVFLETQPIEFTASEEYFEKYELALDDALKYVLENLV